MSSSSRSRTNRRCFIKNRLHSKLLLGLCCFSVLSMIMFSTIGIYEFLTSVVNLCQVKSVDVIQRKNLFYPRWTIQVWYEERTIVEYVTGPTGLSAASRAWRIAEQYKVEFELKDIPIFLSSLDQSNICMLSFFKSRIRCSMDVEIE